VPAYTELDAREAVAAARNYSDAIRRVGLRPVGGNYRLFKRYVNDVWRIPTDHFDPASFGFRGTRRSARPMHEILVEHSTYSRSALKRRLYEAGVKQPACELCGQGGQWRGKSMSLILDHVNGVWDDNRLENLRIVCPNCNATLDTHCGRHNRRGRPDRECRVCGATFKPKAANQRHCGRFCGTRHLMGKNRRVDRPPFDQLMRELAATSYVAVGRKYGVSDNAIRKWLKTYEALRREEARKRRTERADPAGSRSEAAQD